MEAVVEGSVLRAGDRVRITNLRQGFSRTLVLHDGSPRNHTHAANLRQVGDQFVGHAISKVVLPRITGKDSPAAARRWSGSGDCCSGAATLSRCQYRSPRTVQLVEAATDRHLWTESYERDLRDVLALQGQLANAIAQEIKIMVTPQEQAHLAASAHPVSPEAYQLYLKGRYFWNKRTEDGLRKALEYFQRAIDLDPNYALAYAGLADCYVLLSDYGGLPPKDAFPRAKAAGLKALEIDDKLAEAYPSLAWVRCFYDWDFPGAEGDFKRAIELNPNYATAHHWYGWYLALMGRFEEAIAQVKKAQELDPLSLVINTKPGKGALLRAPL